MYTVYMWKFSEPQTKKEVWPQTRLLLKANLLTSSFLEQWKRTTLQTNHPSLISVWNYWLSSWNLVMWLGLIGKKNDESSNGGTSSALVTQCRRQVSGSRVDQWTWGTDATSCCWGSRALAPWWPPWWEGRCGGCCRCKKWCRWNPQMLHEPAGIIIRN